MLRFVPNFYRFWNLWYGRICKSGSVAPWSKTSDLSWVLVSMHECPTIVRRYSFGVVLLIEVYTRCQLQGRCAFVIEIGNVVCQLACVVLVLAFRSIICRKGERMKWRNRGISVCHIDCFGWWASFVAVIMWMLVIDSFVEQIWLLEFAKKIGVWVLWHKFRKKWFQIYVETLFFSVVPCPFWAMNLASRRKWPSWLRSLWASVTQLQRCGLHIVDSCHQIPGLLVSRSIYTSILQVAVLLQLFKCEPWLEFLTPSGNFGGSCRE